MADNVKQLPIASSHALAKALMESGVLPPNCRRFLIDSGEPGGLLKVFYECYADERVLDAFVAAGIVTKTP